MTSSIQRRLGFGGGALLTAALCFAGTALAEEGWAPRLDAAYHNYQPPYPDTAQVNGEQGNVKLKVEVGTSGKVRNVRILESSGFADLDNAAIEGVMSWRYLPAQDNDGAVTTWTTVTISYRLPTAIITPPSKS